MTDKKKEKKKVVILYEFVKCDCTENIQSKGALCQWGRLYNAQMKLYKFIWINHIFAKAEKYFAMRMCLSFPKRKVLGKASKWKQRLSLATNTDTNQNKISC